MTTSENTSKQYFFLIWSIFGPKIQFCPQFAPKLFFFFLSSAPACVRCPKIGQNLALKLNFSPFLPEIFFLLNNLNSDVSNSPLNTSKCFPIYTKLGGVISYSNMYKHGNMDRFKLSPSLFYLSKNSFLFSFFLKLVNYWRTRQKKIKKINRPFLNRHQQKVILFKFSFQAKIL